MRIPGVAVGLASPLGIDCCYAMLLCDSDIVTDDIVTHGDSLTLMSEIYTTRPALHFGGHHYYSREASHQLRRTLHLTVVAFVRASFARSRKQPRIFSLSCTTRRNGGRRRTPTLPLRPALVTAADILPIFELQSSSRDTGTPRSTPGSC